jgi:hypothetical protein
MDTSRLNVSLSSDDVKSTQLPYRVGVQQTLHVVEQQIIMCKAFTLFMHIFIGDYKLHSQLVLTRRD